MNSNIKIIKKKIINDPVYGFVDLPSGLIFDVVEHSYFQRLRRIKQLGLTYLVYPGAIHTRFQHAIGAMHLMSSAIEVLRNKGHEITEEEAKGVMLAILLHDIGHGPFSHALEKTIVNGISHEEISLMYMNRLNEEFGGKLKLAISIFQNKYKKTFLHQLVSSQLDMDRLDYLRRDSYFSGVTEGAIGSDRIIKMLNVVNGNLVIDAKGIYSIEKFLISRRFMYWQVYLHKTVLAAEQLLVKILERAKELARREVDLFATPALKYFLYNNIEIEKFKLIAKGKTALDYFAELDDYDIISSIKVWSNGNDKVLSILCKNFLNRKLLKIDIQKQPFNESAILELRNKVQKHLTLNNSEINYFVFSGEITSNTYRVDDDKINILYKDGTLVDITEASDMLNVSVLSRNVIKNYVCYFKI